MGQCSQSAGKGAFSGRAGQQQDERALVTCDIFKFFEEWFSLILPFGSKKLLPKPRLALVIATAQEYICVRFLGCERPKCYACSEV